MPVSTRPCYKMLVAHRILCEASGAIVVLALFRASYFSVFSHIIIFLWSLMLNIRWDFVHVLEIDSVLLQTCLLFIHSWVESPGHLKNLRHGNTYFHENNFYLIFSFTYFSSKSSTSVSYYLKVEHSCETFGGGSVITSCLTLVSIWTLVRQAPLSMGFPSQEYWSRWPFPSPGDLPNPGTTQVSCMRILYHWATIKQRSSLP